LHNTKLFSFFQSLPLIDDSFCKMESKLLERVPGSRALYPPGATNGSTQVRPQRSNFPNSRIHL
jgi:hypothetical protein